MANNWLNPARSSERSAMSRRATVITVTTLLVSVIGQLAWAQTSTYHLHKEVSATNSAWDQLKTAGPDATATALASADMKNGSPAEFVSKRFDTQAGVPNTGGIIGSGTSVSFAIFMSKSANFGTMFPRFKVFLNNESGTLLCTATGGTALTTTVTKYTLSCTTSAAITMSTTDHFFLWAGVNLTVGPGNHSVTASVSVEGTLNGNYDSTVTAPLPQAPSVTSVTPNRGPKSTVVHIVGTNFGATQGGSSVKFNGVTATQINSWGSTAIDALVPATASTGPATVTVGGAASNGVTFTVTPSPSITSLTPNAANVGQSVTIAGQYFLANQSDGASTVKFNGTAASVSTWSDTSISTTVPAGATTGNVVVTVSGNASNGSAFTVYVPTITSLSPSAAAIGQTVTVNGSHFLATQGASTVKFNGTAAMPTGWSDTAITVPVPAGATTGPVVVTVNGVASNGVTFTVVTTGTVSGTITRATGGSALSGATVQAVLIGVTTGTATSAADGTYSIPNLNPGTYDVRVLATGYSSEVRSGTSVSANVTTTVNVAMLQPGSISGKVTQADGITPIVGAAVTLYSGPFQKGSASTNATGDYSVTNLHPGAYTVQAANAANRTKEQGATITENTNTIANLSLDPAGTGPVTYAYDELGRLVQVTDPSGESAIYRYDLVGNILAIERPGSSGVSISEFTPNGAIVGTTVTIYGAGFSATPSQNTVTFNGVVATVTSASTIQLVVTVPSSATTGTVGITTPLGSATSSTAFTVLTSNGVPTITSITPNAIVAAGTALTVNGTNFDTVVANNNLQLNISPSLITSATGGTTIQSTVPATATTGRVTVATASGSVTTSDYLWIAPPPYTTSSVDGTGVVLPVETDTSFSVAANKVKLFAFDGIQGHRASVKIHLCNTCPSTYGYLYDAFGTLIQSVLVASTDDLIDATLLRSTATYTVVVTPVTAATSTGSVTLFDVPADFAATTAPTQGGATTTVHILKPGQNGQITFPGTAGNRVSLNAAGGTITGFIAGCDVNVSILNPDGTTLAPNTCMEQSGFIDATTLPTSGTYTIFINPLSWSTGDLPLTLYDVPTDVSGSLTINASPTPVSLMTPGQNASFTVTGAGQQATVQLSNNSFPQWLPGQCVTVSLWNAATQTQITSTSSCNSNFNLQGQTLATGTTYTVKIDPLGNSTGSISVQVTSP
jgi:YD repeat-containing protein